MRQTSIRRVSLDGHSAGNSSQVGKNHAGVGMILPHIWHAAHRTVLISSKCGTTRDIFCVWFSLAEIVVCGILPIASIYRNLKYYRTKLLRQWNASTARSICDFAASAGWMILLNAQELMMCPKSTLSERSEFWFWTRLSSISAHLEESHPKPAEKSQRLLAVRPG